MTTSKTPKPPCVARKRKKVEQRTENTLEEDLIKLKTALNSFFKLFVETFVLPLADFFNHSK